MKSNFYTSHFSSPYVEKKMLDIVSSSAKVSEDLIVLSFTSYYIAVTVSRLKPTLVCSSEQKLCDEGKRRQRKSAFPPPSTPFLTRLLFLHHSIQTLAMGGVSVTIQQCSTIFVSRFTVFSTCCRLLPEVQ